MNRTRLAILFVLVLAVAGCQRGEMAITGPGDEGVQVELAIRPDPPVEGPATVTVTLRDVEGAPLAGATVELEGNMHHAGMVPVLATAIELAPGRYEAGLTFTMPGDWFILVRAALPDGRSLERTIDVPGVQSP